MAYPTGRLGPGPRRETCLNHLTRIGFVWYNRNMKFGAIFTAFEAIENTSSTNEKLAIFERLLAVEPGVEEIVRYTYNPFANYYVSPVMPKLSAGDRQSEYSDEQMVAIWTNVKLTLEAMAKRELSGNNAKQAMQSRLVHCGNREICHHHASYTF